MSGPAHDWLVKRAVKWLLGRGRCTVALAEPWNAKIGEHPDAIGWDRRGWSIVVECKVSRADFVADKRKQCRRMEDTTGEHLGQERYYLTPPHLVLPADVPDGWGLLEAHKRSTRIVVPCPRRATYREPGDQWDRFTPIDETIRTAEWGVILPALRQAAFDGQIKAASAIPEDDDGRNQDDRERQSDAAAIGAQ